MNNKKENMNGPIICKEKINFRVGNPLSEEWQ
jgi:hypothetical protein